VRNLLPFNKGVLLVGVLRNTRVSSV